MNRKARMDAFGAASLTGFSLFLAFNQIVIKFVNQGLQPVFFAGLRSAIAVLCLMLWMWAKGQQVRLKRCHLVAGMMVGLAFSAEFICLFNALDLTTVTRTSIILYSMPVWLTIAAHFVLPDERMTVTKVAGLALAFSGVAWAILDRPIGQGQVSLLGDLLALLAAWGWAAVALVARGTNLREEPPEIQLLWQLLVSAPVLLLAATFFGPLIRDFQPVYLAGLMFQGVAVAAAGYMFWFWLLSIYPAALVASFSFLTPVFGVFMGWLVLDEHVGLPILGAAALVAIGIILINRPARA
jgi:drug/metabolite transporter (DMT)-like permease